MGCLLPPQIPASSPDRCIRVRETPETPFKKYTFIFDGESSVDLTCEWSESTKASPATGFLDLPKEIRDIIYQNICDHLSRKGIKWNLPAAYLHIRKRRSGGKVETTVPFDCSIMRTCRQLHYEFAERLYSSPIHLSLSNESRAHRLPFHAAYRPLIKKVFVVMFDKRHNHGDFDRNWRQTLNLSQSLLDACPHISELRVGWDVQWFSLGQEYSTFFGGDRGSDVGQTKNVIEKWTGGTTIPHQLELVVLYDNGSVDSPICEAVRELRNT